MLGTTPALLEKGIPDNAFKPIEGDDKEYCRIWKQHNKQMPLFEGKAPIRQGFEVLSKEFLKVAEMDDSTIWGVKEMQSSWGKATQSASYLNERMMADTWCSAFVWVKKPIDKFASPITNVLFRKLEAKPEAIDENVKREVKRLSEQYHFFHWHLAFPDVFRLPGNGERSENEEMGWNGGFDVVLGNPPWERVKLQEKEWFAGVRPDIANASNAAKRRELIQAFKKESPSIYNTFLDAKRQAEGLSHILRNSGKYPLCGRGDINTYTVFAETKRGIINSTGRVGCIVPTGIATDDTTKFFFRDLIDSSSIISFFDFANQEGIFLAVDRNAKFTLLTLTGREKSIHNDAKFIFFATHVKDLKDDKKYFYLSSEDIALLNPNTRNCPVFRSRRDSELTKAIYRSVPILFKEGPPIEDPYKIKFFSMFHMTNEAHYFHNREQLESAGYTLNHNIFKTADELYLPLYEAKMMHIMNHRFANAGKPKKGSFIRGSSDYLSDEDYENPYCYALPRYWVAEEEVNEKVRSKGWNNKWFISFRDITGNVANIRTAVFSILPWVGVGNKAPLVLFKNDIQKKTIYFISCVTSFAFDYITRQSIGGTTLNYFILKQLPVISPYSDKKDIRFTYKTSLYEWLGSRVLELTYTAWDLKYFAQDFGYGGEPFRWNEDRRFLIRCELDAAYFHLYSISKNDVDYIMETFPIVKSRDEKKFGDYRTKLMILKIYDQMKKAMETGEPYQTILDPPPADPRVAHPLMEK